jgi:hypothetical protein
MTAPRTRRAKRRAEDVALVHHAGAVRRVWLVAAFASGFLLASTMALLVAVLLGGVG